MEKKLKQVGGFTLIELLIAITIIGILVTIGLGSFSSTQMKARDAKRKSDLESMARALELYYNDCGSYPVSSSGSIVGCGATGSCATSATTCSWGGAFIRNNVQYMQELPDDPSGDYFYVSTGASYQLYARLENISDGAVPHTGTTARAYQNTTCRSGTLDKCNYGTRSSNADTQGTVVDDD